MNKISIASNLPLLAILLLINASVNANGNLIIILFYLYYFTLFIIINKKMFSMIIK